MAWQEVAQLDWDPELETDPQEEDGESLPDVYGSSGETEKDPKLNGTLVPLVLLDRSAGIETSVKIRVRLLFILLNHDLVEVATRLPSICHES